MAAHSLQNWELRIYSRKKVFIVSDHVSLNISLSSRFFDSLHLHDRKWAPFGIILKQAWIGLSFTQVVLGTFQLGIVISSAKESVQFGKLLRVLVL